MQSKKNFFCVFLRLFYTKSTFGMVALRKSAKISSGTTRLPLPLPRCVSGWTSPWKSEPPEQLIWYSSAIRKAVAVVVMFLAICAASTVLLMATNHASALDVIYETVSATATVGLSRNLTATLNTFGKLIIIVTMYFGRVGPISLAVAFGSKNESQNVISEPTESINIG